MFALIWIKRQNLEALDEGRLSRAAGILNACQS